MLLRAASDQVVATPTEKILADAMVRLVVETRPGARAEILREISDRAGLDARANEVAEYRVALDGEFGTGEGGAIDDGEIPF